MARTPKPHRLALGTPTTIVLYRTPDRWRYAVYFAGPGGVADGALGAPSPSCEPGAAQAAAVRKAEELGRRRLEVRWHAAHEPGWWTGTVTDAGPLPPA
ncbi:hypothetical protein [Streptomyces sp. NPDC031705]|uniref:hypothetical protein n=1 Tax=Streptomyces sp. NPDC031705 TaxID=3155729 RepID=UPI0033C82E17